MLLRQPVGFAVVAAQAIQLPVALASSAVHAIEGRLDLRLAALCGLLMLAGSLAGQRAAAGLDMRQLQRFVSLLLLAVGSLVRLAAARPDHSKEPCHAVLPKLCNPRRPLLLAPEWVMLPEGPRQGLGVRGARRPLRAGGPAGRRARRASRPRAPIELPQRLLMPGLIDTHTHLTQSFGKALAFGEPSEIFRRIWVPMEATLDADAAYLSAKLSALESLRGGFTTVVDAGTRSEAGLDAVASAARDAGIRCVLGMICNDAGARRRRGRGAPHPRRGRDLPGAARARPAGASLARDLDPRGRDRPHAARRRRAHARKRPALPDACQRAPGGRRALAGGARPAPARSAARLRRAQCLGPAGPCHPADAARAGPAARQRRRRRPTTRWPANGRAMRCSTPACWRCSACPSAWAPTARAPTASA